MVRRLAWPLIISIASCSSSIGFAQDEPPKNEPAPAEAPQPQKWEFGISIRAVGGPCAGLFGTVPVPMEWPEQQVKVATEQVTPHVRHHTYRTTDGLKQLVFEIPQIASGDTATCFVTYEIVRHPIKPPADPDRLIIAKNPPRDVRGFLAPSPLIESTNPKLRVLVKEWTSGKETAWEQLQGIVAGVQEKVKFEPDNTNVFKGAAGALRDGKADREDLTATFVAAARLAKLPARIVWAIDYCYAEVYLEREPIEEEPAAASAGAEAESKPKKPAKKKENSGAWYPVVVHDKVELGAVSDPRPILAKGDNFKVPEEKAPQRWVKEYLTGKGGGGKPSVEFRRRAAD